MLRYLDDPPRVWNGERLRDLAIPPNAEQAMTDNELNNLGVGREVQVRPEVTAKQVLVEPPTYARTDPTVTVTWVVRDKTQEEIDAELEAVIPPVDDVQIDALVDHENRLRKIEGQPVITPQQYRALLKKKLKRR